MRFLLSGEGPTDLGTCATNSSPCQGEDYLHGPLAVIVDHLVQGQQNYSPLEHGQFVYVSKVELVARASGFKAARKPLRLPGRDRPKETRYFFNNARALALVANDAKKAQGDDVVAVLFRDSDGTASADRGLWDDKLQSMRDGFLEERFDRGVPMLPRPKSEAWLLCALKNQYRGCHALEGRSGSDDSPQSLKKELADFLRARPTREALCQLVVDGKVDCQKIEMPSYAVFKARLEEVI